MKKLLLIILISNYLLSSCSVDWNDGKDKRIAELEKTIQDDTFQKNKECIEYYEKNRESLYWENSHISTVSLWFSKELSSCFYAYSVRNWDLRTTQFLIDDLFKKESIFTSSLVVDNPQEEQAEWKRFHDKITVLKWSCPEKDPLCLFE